MIEKRDKWRLTSALWLLAEYSHHFHLPWEWLFQLGARARKCQYRVGGGLWESYKSLQHLNAVRLYHGEGVIDAEGNDC